MNFHVGQKVVCVDDTANNGPLSANMHNLIRKGEVYTIRDIDHRAAGIHGSPSVRLEEVACPIQPATILGPWEPGFHPRRFRPAIERKTDIGIFTALLKPKQLAHT